MRTTKIEWTERTWNPVTGCTKQSPGCAHCYAETMARRLHAMGLKTFVAQSSLRTGGTWDGTVKNLRHGWSHVYGFADGSEAMEELAQLGACLIGTEALSSIYDLPIKEDNLFDR